MPQHTLPGKSYVAQPGYTTRNKMGANSEMSTLGSGAARYEETNVTKMRALCHESSFKEHLEKCTMERLQGCTPISPLRT